MLSLRQKLEDRFIKNDETGCWDWCGATSPSGYGAFSGKQAHRLMYELHKGAIPDGLVIRHICHNRCCVNPDHLELGTALDNGRDTRIYNKQNPKEKIHEHWTSTIDSNILLWKKKIDNRFTTNNNGCWIWMGRCSNTGRPELSISSVLIPVSSIVYYIYKEELPYEGMFFSRICTDDLCVNPDHHEIRLKTRYVSFPMDPAAYTYLVKVQRSLGIKRVEALNIILNCNSELVDIDTLRELHKNEAIITTYKEHYIDKVNRMK